MAASSLGKEAPFLMGFFQAVIRRFNGFGRIDDSPDLLGIGKERYDPLPVGMPGLGNGRIAAVPFLGDQDAPGPVLRIRPDIPTLNRQR
jgi:hypothetical protein